MAGGATKPPPLTTPSTIAIVGGGLGGVILGVALLQRGVPFHIYEAAADFGEIGAGVAFGPNSMRNLALISPQLLEACSKHLTSNEGEGEAGTFATFRLLRTTEDGNAGDWVFDLRGGPLAKGQDGLPTRCAVHRAAFLDEIVKLLPPGCATFGKRLVTLDETPGDGSGNIVLHFADGTTASATAVVGCDGIKSATRRYLHGPDAVPVYAGQWCYRSLVPREVFIEGMGPELALNGQIYVGQGGYLVHYPVSNGKIINLNIICSREGNVWPHADWQVPCEIEEMQSDLAGYHPQLLSFSEKYCMRASSGKPLKWALMDNMHSSPYVRGRVCLLGDAAHAATPHLGAGAGMAIEDVYALSQLLGPGFSSEDIEKTFVVYDALRRPRTQEVVRQARLSGLTLTYLDPDVGNDLQKLTATSIERFTWVWDEDMEATVREAKKELGLARA
ncbi:mannitol 1-phosphate dehydrogenase [Thozetella sp. PMI_491]|nr:mannitol 1-phosphate dehydrogenase [Thozetella sp. PMI_491]